MNRQLALVGFGPGSEDRFRFTWHNTREGAACWIEYRGSWRAGVIVHRGRKYVAVMLTGQIGRTVYVRCAYEDLRRRVGKPKLSVVAEA